MARKSIAAIVQQRRSQKRKLPTAYNLSDRNVEKPKVEEKKQKCEEPLTTASKEVKKPDMGSQEEDDDYMFYPLEEGSEEVKKPSMPKVDWYKDLPSRETLMARAAAKKAQQASNPRSTSLLGAPRRPLVALQFSDIGLPDFVEFKYPDSRKFIARR